MVDVAASTDRIEDREDLGTGEAGEWAFWNAQEQIALKAERSWRYRSRAIVRRYRDDRGDDTGNTNSVSSGLHRFNILWSNVQTLIPTLYGRTPKPDVERRFKDQDDSGRLGALLIERCLSYSMGEYGFDAAMRAAVEDRLLPGRGIARVLYVPHFGDPLPGNNEQFEQEGSASAEVANEGDAGQKSDGQEGQGEPLREVLYEECCPRYVFWEDYLEGPARQWHEVPWIRYRAYLTRAELVERFGKKGKKVNLDFTPKGTPDGEKSAPPADIYKKAVIHETWDKVKMRVVWWAPGTPDLILDEVDDPLGLPGFFANPDPLLATTTNDKRIPVPDYIEYQDQARELDTLTARIDRLTRALKVSGVYAGSEKQVLQQLVDEGTENRLIPVEDWAAFASDKGGIQNLIQWMPIQQVAETLIQLYNARDRVKQLLYEITGIADIIRGATSPVETMGAQQLKSQFATLRIQPQQRDVARFSRDLVRLMASVIMQQFSEKTISMITGYPQLQPVPQLPPAPPAMIPSPGAMQQPSNVVSMTGQPMGQPPMIPNPALGAWQQMAAKVQAIVQQNQALTAQFQAAVKLLREDAHEGFRIDIEADSTVAADEQAEKQSRVEFLQQFVPLLQQVVPIAEGNPALAALAKEVTLFAMRGFKVSRTLEETVEKAFEAIAQMPPNPNAAAGKNGKGGAGADPQAIQAKIHDTDSKAATERLKIAADQQESQAELALRGAEMQEESALRGRQQLLDAAKIDDQRSFRQTRIEGIEARSAEGLK